MRGRGVAYFFAFSVWLPGFVSHRCRRRRCFCLFCFVPFFSDVFSPEDPKWAIHKADPSRAQEDLSNGFGIEDRGVPREWNDEYQCLLELPNDSPDLVSKVLIVA